MKRFLYFFIASLCVAGILSCSSDEPEAQQNDYVPMEITADQSRLINAQRGVGFTMWDAVKSTCVGDNMVLSPISVTMFTSMLANGADGATREAIFEGLGMKGESLDMLNELNSKVLSEFPGLDNKVNLAIANSIWTNSSKIALHSSFTERMKSLYSLEYMSLGNDGEKNKTDINKWIEDKTHGLIKDFYSSPVFSSLELVNTIYFKAPWASSNVKERTVKFTSQSGETVNVAGFGLSGRALVDDNLTVASASYGNGAFRITIVMPESGALPSGKEIASKWDSWKSYMSAADLTMPEWDVYKKYSLDGPLTEMGLGVIFAHDASFVNMTADKFHLSEVAHGVHVITNKKGTEAAAVTGGGFIATGPLKEVEFNRPFVYVITESSTGAVLFIGEVTKL